MKGVNLVGALGMAAALAAPVVAEAPRGLEATDAFHLEVASDAQISPDGARVVYVRGFADVKTDRRYSNLWMLGVDGGGHRALTSGNWSDRSPRWSPDGTRLAFLSDRDGSTELHVLWLDTGQTARLTNLEGGPTRFAWSPDGRWLAFTGLVKAKPPSIATMPSPPEGSKWAEPAKVIDRLVYRFNGAGYLPDGFSQLFVVPADGGTPRQISGGDFHHGPFERQGGAPVWSPDGRQILISANRRSDWDLEPLDSEVFAFQVADGALKQLTDRRGPDNDVTVSPDGRQIAYVGFDDRYQGYQNDLLWIADRQGSKPRALTTGIDSSAESPRWAPDGRGVYFLYEHRGRMRLALAALDGSVTTVAEDLGSGSSSYTGGAAFSVAANGTIAFTTSRWNVPGDVAVLRPGAAPRLLTALNDDLFAQRRLAEIEEMTVPSSKDGREVHAWLLKPPGFDPTKKHPLILEIHGGPFAGYGPHFDLEKQVWAAKGYVVLYANPRGSTGYGEQFANLIHHAYPGDDFYDLDSVVTAVVSRGFVDTARLFVTGGSGGGVLTCWMIGRTDRFRAAATVYPVINWFSWVLTSDLPAFGMKYWFPGPPWEHTEHYMKRSLFSVFGNVKTPTMVITGEEDWRTPISESEQYYTALKLKGVEAVLVRVPGEPHGIRVRPSHHIAKMLNIVGWFEKHR